MPLVLRGSLPQHDQFYMPSNKGSRQLLVKKVISHKKIGAGCVMDEEISKLRGSRLRRVCDGAARPVMTTWRR